MNRKQFLLTLSVAMISGFLGGTLGVWFLMPPSVLAQDEPEKQTIEAERFVLKDASGRMRAELSTYYDNPVLWFYDEEGKRRTIVGQDAVILQGPDGSQLFLSHNQVQLSANGATLRLTPDSLIISEADPSRLGGKDRIRILGGDSPKITIHDEEALTILGSYIQINGAGGRFQTTLYGDSATFSGDTPSIQIIDKEGFQAVLGSTGTVETSTGRTNRTSAASLMLFGKDKKVIWSAP